MADSIDRTDSIDRHGYPLCLKTYTGQQRPGVLATQDAHDVFMIRARGLGRSVTWVNRQGSAAFAIQSDDRPGGDQAPSALAYAYSGIAFCFMTQLLRYVEHHHMKVRALRLVQLSPCRIESGVTQAQPLDTHVFVHTEEDDEVMESLVQMSARTCYLHAAWAAALVPEISLVLNGGPSLSCALPVS